MTFDEMELRNHNDENGDVNQLEQSKEANGGKEGETPLSKDNDEDASFEPLPPPPPPKELPDRFLKAAKDDPVEGQRRYEATLQWRQELDMDHILTCPHPNFDLIKPHYPVFYHLRGHNGEPCFYEQPPKTQLQAMKNAGVTTDALLHFYVMVTEFQWQYIEQDDSARSIYVLDLDGMGIFDFMPEVIDYLKKSTSMTGQNYPERAGHVLVINVPGWFQRIWDVVKPMIDDVTLQNISILSDKEAILEALKDKIPLENIPPEYGGTSLPLGESAEEQLLRDLMRHNNKLAEGDQSCGGRKNGCRFCSFAPVRSY